MDDGLRQGEELIPNCYIPCLGFLIHCWYFLSIAGVGIIKNWDKKSIAVFEVEGSFCQLKSMIIKSCSKLMHMVQKLTRFGRPNKISIVNLLKHASFLNTSSSISPSNPTIPSMVPHSCISNLLKVDAFSMATHASVYQGLWTMEGVVGFEGMKMDSEMRHASANRQWVYHSLLALLDQIGEGEHN